MTDSTYQGWTNRATWNVNLWINNEEPLYREMRAGRPFTAKSAEAFVRGVFPDGTPDMQAGPADYSLASVDWSAIADSFNEE